MLNTWNDLIKQENNGSLVNNANNVIYENENNSMMLMGGGANNGGMVNSQQASQAQVAAAVATAMMMQNQNNCNNLNMSQMDDCMDDDDCGDDDDDCDSSMNNDAEGVWSPDIEQSFQEALAIYPPCGRRKIILSEEGKMYGRNELIARYIKVRTGKSRSRKQVSSHIQVLAKRKTKDFHSTFKEEKGGKCVNNGALGFSNPFSHLTSAQIISPATSGANSSSNQQMNQGNTQQNQVPTNQHQNIQNSHQMQHMASINGNKLYSLDGSNIQNNNMTQQNNSNLQNHQQIMSQQRNPAVLANHNHQQHPPQMLQNCTNILPNSMNVMQQSQSCNIWSHPGLQPEKKPRIDMSQNAPNVATVPCSVSSPTQNNDEIIPSSSSSSASSSSSVNINHQNLDHTSPNSASPLNQNMWSSYGKNESNSSNKCIIGLQQLRLVEFSGFLEQRLDPDIYNKHLFVHLNTSDYFQSINMANDNNNNNNNLNALNNEMDEEFENIHYKEFADKFPENDLLWSISNTLNNESASSQANSAAYLIKFWVDLNYTLEENVCAMYAVTNIFESPEPISISCSTKVCSFGNQVVEKVETEHARYETNGRCSYRIENSPMCEYMITFINKLKQLPEKNLKNNVLENFSVLQLIKNNDTQELLLTIAYVFEISTSEHGAQHNVYRLTNKG